MPHRRLVDVGQYDPNTVIHQPNALMWELPNGIRGAWGYESREQAMEASRNIYRRYPDAHVYLDGALVPYVPEDCVVPTHDTPTNEGAPKNG